ncbi:MFS transporter, partial [Novosphingobium sp. KN65.2]|uniref:MFS transporter n=1 Tax=Novosphingobium sp. KN65.2 TaxID=1478134 RepID=UPI0006D54349
MAAFSDRIEPQQIAREECVSAGAAQAGPWDAFSPARRWLFLFVLFLAGVSSTMDRGVMSIVLEQLKQEFALSDTMLGLLGGAPFGICYALSSIPLARVADRHGRKRVLFWAALGWAIMTGLCGLATTLPFLILARMGVGLAEGGSTAPSHALIADYFPPIRRAMALAVLTASGTLGTLLASSVGGWVTQNHGWRQAFFVMAAISLPIAFLVLSVLREPRRTAPGAASPPFRQDLAALARKPAFVSVLTGLLFFTAMPFAVIIFTPAFLIRDMGLSATQAGSLFGLATATGTVFGSLAGGYVADRLRRMDDAWLLRLPAILMAVECPVTLAQFSQSGLWPFLVLHSISTALLYAVLPSCFATVQYVCGGG